MGFKGKRFFVCQTHSSEQYRDWSSNGTNCFSQIMLRKLVSLGVSNTSRDGANAGTATPPGTPQGMDLSPIPSFPIPPACPSH